MLLVMAMSTTSTIGQVTANFSTIGPAIGCGSLVVEFQDNSMGNPTSWWWDFGNGLTSTEQNPVVLFNTPGNYNVILEISDSLTTDLHTEFSYIKVKENPQADFSADILLGCAPLSVKFEDMSSSSAPITSWFWNFGDGGNDLLQFPEYVYEQGGDFSVSLLVSDANGCDDLMIISGFVKTEEKPLLDFEATPEFSCNGAQVVDFTNTTASVNPLAYIWDFGDGQTSSSSSPSHLYSTSGSYDVRLMASSTYCKDTLIKSDFAIVDGVLGVDFTSDIVYGCEPYTQVQFLDLSSIHATAWFWDFGDGITSTESSPLHIYTAPGTYDVSLKISYLGNCIEQIIKPGFIEVYPKPEVLFSSDTTQACDVPFDVQFLDNTVGGSLWEWSINDSVVFGNAPIFSFQDFGFYDVGLVVVDDKGCKNEVIIADYIRIDKPISDFEVDINEGCVPLTVQFSDSSFSSNGILSWFWDFGDGNSSILSNPNHVYTSGGEFSVSLEVQNSLGCVEQKNITNLIKTTQAANTNFSANPLSVCGNEPIQFVDLSSSTQPIDSWFWDFGYNPFYNSIEQNPNHSFQDTGTFTVSLITEVGGCYDTLTIEDYVQVNSPISRFYVSAFCDDYLKYRFFNESLNYDSCYWDFDDGTILTTPPSASPVHYFPSYGEYDVTLHVYNFENDCWGVSSQNIRVEPPMPAVSVDSLTPASGCPPLTVLFHDDSPYSAENLTSPLVVWNMIQFGDGNWSNWNYEYTYEEPGYYSVKHMVANPFGCKDTLVLDSLIHVYEVESQFEPEVISCNPFTVELHDLSVGDEPPAFWEWKFGDGEYANVSNPTHIYLDEGSYSVSLMVGTDGGCSDTIRIDSLITFEKPKAEFVSLGASCQSDTVNFQNYSTAAGLQSIWDFGDGEQSVLFNESHAYSQLGSYNMQLLAIDSFGCADTAFRTIHIQKPTASFVSNNLTANCPPLIAGFNDVSSVGVVQWLWDFGDSSISSVENPSHLYEESGVFDVSLIVVDSIGCRDTIVELGAVNVQGPYGDFSFSANDVCAHEPIEFSPNAFNATNFVWDFGDGTFAVGSTAVHSYDTLGVYYPSLLMENTSSCQYYATTLDSILVEENTVFVDLGEDVSICKNEEIELSLNTNGEILSWLPNIGLSDTTISNPLASPLSTTSYVVTLADGYCQNKDTITVFVDENLPKPGYTTDKLCYNTIVEFTDTSVFDNLASWEWDFGDGNTSQELNPQHFYTTVGLVPISLTITYDSTECASTLLDTLMIHSLPIADAGESQSVCKGDEVELIASGGILYDWGEGEQLSPVLNTALFETTVLTVAVVDENGCADTDEVAVFVNDLPFLEAGVDVDICLGEEVSLLASGSGEFNWEEGASFSSSYQISPLSTTTVLVELVDENGCKNDDELLIRVHPKPTVTLAANSEVCLGEKVSFRGYGSAGSDNIVDWNWNFGNGFFENKKNTNHTYATEGVYSISLTAISDFGCENTFEIQDLLTVHPAPAANFYAKNEEVTDIMNEVQFENYSSGETMWEWDFGDGNYSNVQMPINSYATAGNYNVSLKVWNDFGCHDELTKELVVESDYTFWIPNSFTPNGDGVDESFIPKGFGIEQFSMLVFTRWGEEIFVTQELTQGWEGKLSNGSVAPVGIYTYRIMTEDENGKIRTYQGEINLIL